MYKYSLINNKEFPKNTTKENLYLNLEILSYEKIDKINESLEIKKIESSGYKGMQIKIKETSGKIIIKNIPDIQHEQFHLLH